MTEPPSTTPPHEPSSDDADLLASLYLDGEATAEERTRVEADPALLARVDEFRRLANAVGAPAVPPPGLAATQITAALEQFGIGAAATSVEPDQRQGRDPSVVSLTDRRARRSAPPAWIGAAAVAALVVGGLGFVATQGGDDDEAASVDTSLSASAADAAGDGETATTPFQREELATEAAESELMEDAPADDAADAGMAADDEGDAGDSDSADEEAAPAPLTPDEAADFYAVNGPIDLTELEATSAGDYYEQILDAPVQSVEASPCADSAVVADLRNVDGFIPVIYEGRTASLFVTTGDPTTATIVGPTCEIELD